MPPSIKSIAPPGDAGPDAQRWLEAHGIFARTPTIRSSDYSTIRSSPFNYYLGRRLGLSSRLRWSEALSRGSWYHKALELDDLSPKTATTPAFTQAYYAELKARLTELDAICKETGIIGDARERILTRETEDADYALTLYQVARVIPVSRRVGSPSKFFSHSKWRVLSSELRLTVQHDDLIHVAQFDKLLYNTATNSLWIRDDKSTQSPTELRLLSCPMEFQVQHYLAILEDALKAGTIHELFPDLPENVKLGGMIHVAVRKPKLKFGREDRPFREYEHTITRGPRKGQVETRRDYHGEPSRTNYLRRIRDKMLATGPYKLEAPEREASPYVNISFTTHQVALVQDDRFEYNTRLQEIEKYARADAYPRNFPRGESALDYGGKSEHPFAAFALLPPKDWPGIIAKEGLIQTFRDEDLITPKEA